MNQIAAAITWLTTSSHWTGSGSIGIRISEHLWYTLLALIVAATIAIPAGLAIGHTGRGKTVAVACSGALRALPSLGLLTLLTLSTTIGIGNPVVPSTIVLAILAIPPLLAGSYSGVEAVVDEVADGARACGMTQMQVLRRVELPLAAPLLLGGLRSAALQVIATTTICSYLGMGGLGRFILDGLAVSDYPQMLAGSIVIIALALVTDGLLSLATHLLIDPGVKHALALTPQ
ncbi:ABC transporter permease subunit [Propionibacterium sp. NM47_B9-13]|uniref:Osmoprotectant (Glycine betaine/ carnitine/choline/l-proline) ABC transporter ProZ n=2 Tax=Cutibacterium modestum TaxID=2559073 RepID=A0AAD1KMQ6_9ACTN|nr:ABC transporter permease subunit [Cutibacterium modestum]TGY28767.1 ABC transporter permease subunit [Propionibacterium sp. NM47_B9-13]AOH45275.1 ABC transporter permease [Cutibacterium modestum]EFS73257.1 ABC transporter, permease protein [Cutibacterium modestum HL037PA2]EFS92413.1 ABC transporter, permease protein [Cutibacterium modestum HL044PA1]EFT14467.1 ABC transporter, permease protein [Cutibacterium modestum HL037PA3]